MPDTQAVAYDYGDLMLHFELRRFGYDLVLYQGDSKGGGGPTVKPVSEVHEQNWLECTKSRKEPNSDIEIGRSAEDLIHLRRVYSHFDFISHSGSEQLTQIDPQSPSSGVVRRSPISRTAMDFGSL